MIGIAFGRWDLAAGRWFIRKRIYWKGYIWTPFVRVKRRYVIQDASAFIDTPKE